MHLAIINKQTLKVENVTTLPGMVEHNGELKPSVWFCPDGYIAIETETGAIGDTYDQVSGEFTKPAPPVSEVEISAQTDYPDGT